jgi:ATP-dependent helicase YprA (DUF1998 family)
MYASLGALKPGDQVCVGGSCITFQSGMTAELAQESARQKESMRLCSLASANRFRVGIALGAIGGAAVTAGAWLLLRKA